jgi:hypothetical protein
MYFKVEGSPNLIRDKNTNAILNINTVEYENYKRIKQSKEIEKNRVEKIEKEVIEIKQDLNVIKDLLMEIKNGSK